MSDEFVPKTALAAYWERAAIALLGIVMTFVVLGYNNTQADLKNMETRLLSLQIDKVGKDDLREVETRFNKALDAKVSELISRSSADKQDILARIDLYFKSHIK